MRFAILKNRARIMPLAACVGFLLPSVADRLLPILPQVLFLLMLLTLLQLNITALWVKMRKMTVWRYALFCVVGCALLGVPVVYLLGARDEWLLVIAGVLVSAPLFGSGAIVSAIGFDAKDAMAKTIASTLIMPLPLLTVLYLLADGASLDFGVYATRLVVFIIAPIVLAIGLKKAFARAITRHHAAIGTVNFFVLLAFPFGLVGSFRHLLDQNLMLGLKALGLGIILTIVPFLAAYFFYQKSPASIKMTHALLAGGGNMLLAYAISAPNLGNLFIPVVGAMQLPIFCLPILAKAMLRSAP